MTTAKTVAIVQSNYIPWKGYFDLINSVDEFILYDDMQFTRRDWRNRNKIKTPKGAQWLTIPVQVKGKYFQAIKDTLVSDEGWGEKHWRTLEHNYARAPHFRDYEEIFKPIYFSGEKHLSQINHQFLTAICGLLNINTKVSWSMDYELAEGKTERLVSLCQQAGADHYISGPAAQAYMEESLFSDAGMKLSYMDYSDYPEYPQLDPPFTHYVSILDLLFMVGADATQYMRSFNAD